ncbi:MAG: sugar phosphate isomerase/epimerase [Clostridia bacterium]|nr:sugar phosphate isomerase/epimerase [Clostridia bacterium]
MAGNIGIATGVFWNEYGEECIDKLAKIGYNALDFSMFTDGHKRLKIFDESLSDEERYFSSVKNRADGNGVTIAQTHLSFPIDYDTDRERRAIVDKLLPELDASLILGAPYVVIHPSRKLSGLGNFAEGVENYGKIITAVNEHIKGTNLQVCVENIPIYNKYKYCRVQGACTRADDLIKYVGKFGVGACLDTGHSHLVGENPAYVARKLGKNLKVMHINDNYGIDDDHIMPYTGGINWSQLATALKEIGYKGDYCAEIDGLLSRIKRTDREFMFDVASTNCKLLKKFREEVEG